MDIYTIGIKEQLRLLRRVSTPIEDINENINNIANNMIETMRRANGIGLAGPQVGLLEQIFTVQIGDDKPLVFINPEITETSVEYSSYEEGCLSIPEQYGQVKRPAHIKVQAWNLRGRPFTIDAEGLLATVIQHELDHLKGILFLDYLSTVKRKKILSQFHIELSDYPEPG